MSVITLARSCVRICGRRRGSNSKASIRKCSISAPILPFTPMTQTEERLTPVEKAELGISPEVVAAAKDPPLVTDSHVFFFGHNRDTVYKTFSQWYPARFNDQSTIPETTFLTTEQYMMYSKALLMGDTETAGKILCASTPGEAKKLGRLVTPFDQAKWDAECDSIVEKGNWLKFSQDQNCREALLATGDRTIVEASPNDRIWGIGFRASQAEGKESEWGENKLGKALMRVRDRLRGDSSV